MSRSMATDTSPVKAPLTSALTSCAPSENGQLRGPQQAPDLGQVHMRRAHGALHARLGEALRQPFDESGVFGARAMHFPVAGDQRLSHVSPPPIAVRPKKGRAIIAMLSLGCNHLGLSHGSTNHLSQFIA